jgi:protein-S-isoprenylcysteine O-methyltransferase Ste14
MNWILSATGVFWLFCCLSWWLFELWLNQRKRSPVYNKALDKDTLTLLEWVNALSVSTALISSFTIDLPIIQSDFFILPGSILMISGLMIRALTVYSMGKNFTVDISIQDNHKLNTKGWFKYIRHPSYSALYLSFIGLAITLNNLIATGLLLIPTLLALLHRIKQEEKVLIQKFNDQYLDYKRKTHALIPFIY